MTDSELQQWVEHISLTSFGRPFRHKAVFNRRLRTTGGRYFMKTHNIDISWRQYEAYGKSEVEKIIKHELCHYHLHLMNKGYRHRDPAFKALLKQVGGSRYCKPLPAETGRDRKPEAVAGRASAKQTKPFKYKLQCKQCDMIYYRKRRMDPNRYVCGKCKGKLTLTLL